MPGNTLGEIFKVTTFGESHGTVIGAVIDGCPPNLEISEEYIQVELDRRKPGTSRFTSPRKEADQVKILSGVFAGKTTGAPIGLLIENKDQRPQDYSKIKDSYRPAHADYTYQHKYGIRDYRGGGRSSARETAMRVAAGAIAKKYLLEKLNINIYGFLSQLGNIKCGMNDVGFDKSIINTNLFFCGISSKIAELEKYMNNLKKDGDSIGAKITIVAESVPVGLGEPVFDKLDADIAKAMMSINAVKGVEIGDGFDVVGQRGSEHRDMLTPQGFASNHAGGILGGISSGQSIIAHIALKPTSSISIPGQTVNAKGEAIEIITKGRHDPCVGIRATPIGEAQLAIILMDHYCRNRAQNADVVSNIHDIENNL